MLLINALHEFQDLKSDVTTIEDRNLAHILKNR